MQRNSNSDVTKARESQTLSVRPESDISTFWKLVISIIACEAVGAASALLSQTEMNPWFESLNKPWWNPPSDVFIPVWTLLYLLMGLSFWFIWRTNAPEHEKRSAELLFTLQLFLNFWWSILFFRLYSPVASFVGTLMIFIILITIIRFAPISRVAAWLLVPYVSWVGFVTLLNHTIWSMN